MASSRLFASSSPGRLPTHAAGSTLDQWLPRLVSAMDPGRAKRYLYLTQPKHCYFESASTAVRSSVLRGGSGPKVLIRWRSRYGCNSPPVAAIPDVVSAAIAVIQPVPYKAHYRARATAGGLKKHSLNVCIHWQQQALSSHDELSALGFAPFAIRFAASRISFGRQRGSSIRELQGIWSQRCRALCD